MKKRFLGILKYPTGFQKPVGYFKINKNNRIFVLHFT